MGYGDLGCYGSDTKSPRIDGKAAEGIRFTDAYMARTVCSHTRTDILIRGNYIPH